MTCSKSSSIPPVSQAKGFSTPLPTQSAATTSCAVQISSEAFLLNLMEVSSGFFPEDESQVVPPPNQNASSSETESTFAGAAYLQADEMDDDDHQRVAAMDNLKQYRGFGPPTSTALTVTPPVQRSIQQLVGYSPLTLPGKWQEADPDSVGGR